MESLPDICLRFTNKIVVLFVREEKDEEDE